MAAGSNVRICCSPLDVSARPSQWASCTLGEDLVNAQVPRSDQGRRREGSIASPINVAPALWRESGYRIEFWEIRAPALARSSVMGVPIDRKRSDTVGE